MTATDFERQHGADWDALEQQLQALGAGPSGSLTQRWQRWRRQGERDAGGATPATPTAVAVDAGRLAQLYRQACEHLALARSRAYPIGRVRALESLTQRAHQAIYRVQEVDLSALRRLLRDGIPLAMVAHRRQLWWALALFALPLLAMLAACTVKPSFVLTVMDAAQARSYAHMYAEPAATGAERTADSDLAMFGFYIGHNIGIAFQCFASGLLAGLGTIFYLVFNGAMIGAVAGYLTALGHGAQFWPFVATHSAFELTGIVISGACGLRLGRALLLPGRERRIEALRQAGLAVMPLVTVTILLLVIAAGLEAFWSSAPWVAAPVKLGASAAAWTGVGAYLSGRFRSTPARPDDGG